MNKIKTFLSSTAGKLAVIATAVFSTLGFGVNAFAAAPRDISIPADPTGGAYDDMSGKLVTWVTTYGVPTLFGLALLGILIRLGYRWMKRAAKAV